MQAVAGEALWLDAWAIFDDMVLAQIKPTAAIFNHLLHVSERPPLFFYTHPCVCKAQRLRSSQHLWPVIEKMNEMNIAPNSSTFSQIIYHFTADGRLEAALQYLYSMKPLNLVPELPAVEAVITLAADSGCPRLAIDLATWFEGISIRRIDQVVWMSCLRSSAEDLYVSL